MLCFSLSISRVHFLQLRLQPLHLREIRSVLVQCIGKLRIQLRAFPLQILQLPDFAGVAAPHRCCPLWRTRTALLCACVRFARRVSSLFSVVQALRGDVLLVVQFPDLVLPFVGQPRVFGILHLHFQLAQLISQKRGSLVPWCRSGCGNFAR